MRSAIVPAQITTVEDKVMGNLNLSQLMLLSSPIFIGSLIYFAFPPNLGGAVYKTVLIVVATLMLWTLAIRFKGRILLLWAITIGRYNLRPRNFVNDKNDLYLRQPQSADDLETTDEAVADDAEKASLPVPALSFADAVFLEQIIANPKANLHFKADRKGALRVHINEDK
jgi:hypothetical protein